MILGFVGFLLVRVCVTLGCLSTPLCGMNDKKKLVIKALRAPSKPCTEDTEAGNWDTVAINADCWSSHKFG